MPVAVVGVGVGEAVGVGVGVGPPPRVRRGEITHPAMERSRKRTAHMRPGVRPR